MVIVLLKICMVKVVLNNNNKNLIELFSNEIYKKNIFMLCF